MMKSSRIRNDEVNLVRLQILSDLVRLQILSDLHLEFGPIELPIVDRDILILAGDIHVGTKADEFILDQLKYSDVIYILGNHEGYDQVLPKLIYAWSKPTTNRINEQARTLGYPGTLYLLHNTSIFIHGIEFIGTTLWTDFDRSNPVTMNLARQSISDHKKILMSRATDFDSNKIRFMPEDALYSHNIGLFYLKEKLIEPGKKIVITHHLPSHQSIGENYRGDPLSGAYASNLDQLIYDHQPAMWIHGHSHTSADYMLDNTRIVCNPRGYYPHSLNPEFRPDFIIEV